MLSPVVLPRRRRDEVRTNGVAQEYTEYKRKLFPFPFLDLNDPELVPNTLWKLVMEMSVENCFGKSKLQLSLSDIFVENSMIMGEYKAKNGDYPRYSQW